jgi:hypothetical protein
VVSDHSPDPPRATLPVGRAVLARPQERPVSAGTGFVQGTPLVLTLSTLELRKGSPFFDMLATFVAATAGLTPVFDAEHYPAFLQGVGGEYRGMVWPTMTVDLGDAVGRFRTGILDASTAEIQLCCMLANAAWEAARFASKHPSWDKPEVQFFRHVRNAASHGNRWSFKEPSGRRPGTPDLPAAWRGLELDHTRKGRDNPLQHLACFGRSLSSADLLRLLLDVETLLL